MELPKSTRLKYRLMSRSEEDKNLSVLLDTNPINRKFFPNGALSEKDIPKMIERFVGGYEKYKAPIFMVFDERGTCIGRAGFAYAEELDAIEIGYLLDHQYWGKGYATEIAVTLLNWAKDNLEFSEIFAFATIDHLASIAVMKKAGMSYVRRQTLKNVDCVLYRKNLG